MRAFLFQNDIAPGTTWIGENHLTTSTFGEARQGPKGVFILDDHFDIVNYLAKEKYIFQFI